MTSRKRRNHLHGWGEVIFTLALIPIAVLIWWACGAATGDDGVVPAAEAAGWTEIEILSKDAFITDFSGCARFDNAKFTIRGTNPDGQVREAFVCDGVFTSTTFSFSP